MAKLQSGLTGKITGKLGGSVMGVWKGINWAREYVTPANPQSSGQVTNRNKFAYFSKTTRKMYENLVKPYYKPLIEGLPLSEWNRHIQHLMNTDGLDENDLANYSFEFNNNLWAEDPEVTADGTNVTVTWSQNTSYYNFPDSAEDWTCRLLVLQANEDNVVYELVGSTDALDEGSASFAEEDFKKDGTYNVFLIFENPSASDELRFASVQPCGTVEITGAE